MLEEMMRKREQAEIVDKEQKKEKDKEELATFIAAKIRTAFIGALAAFEGEFGEIWGHNVLRPTDEQMKEKELWGKVRKIVLDKGNDQIKFARNEIEKYNMEKVGVRTEIDLNTYWDQSVQNFLKNNKGV